MFNSVSKKRLLLGLSPNSPRLPSRLEAAEGDQASASRLDFRRGSARRIGRTKGTELTIQTRVMLSPDSAEHGLFQGEP